MTYRLNSRMLAVVAILMVLLIFGGLMLVAAQESDGRINTRDHVGGAAVYCVDEHGVVAEDWHEGGIRVLNANGQILLDALAADITAAGDPPEETVQVGSGANAYGSLDLYYRPDSNFQLMGTDEHSKAFEFVWEFCGSLPGPALPPAPEVTIEPTVCVYPALQPEAHAGAPAVVTVPCELGS